jgi:hypothetical protein
MTQNTYNDIVKKMIHHTYGDRFIAKDHGIYYGLIVYAQEKVCNCRWCVGAHHPIKQGEVRFGREVEKVLDEIEPDGMKKLKSIYKTNLQLGEGKDTNKVVSRVPMVLKDHQQYSKIVGALLHRVIGFYQVEYLFDLPDQYQKERQELETLLCEVEPDSVQKIKAYFADTGQEP